MATLEQKQHIDRTFDKIHMQFSLCQKWIENIDDPVAAEIFRDWQKESLKQMRALRRYLEIPYDLHRENNVVTY